MCDDLSCLRDKTFAIVAAATSHSPEHIGASQLGWTKQGPNIDKKQYKKKAKEELYTVNCIQRRTPLHWGRFLTFREFTRGSHDLRLEPEGSSSESGALSLMKSEHFPYSGLAFWHLYTLQTPRTSRLDWDSSANHHNHRETWERAGHFDKQRRNIT